MKLENCVLFRLFFVFLLLFTALAFNNRNSTSKNSLEVSDCKGLRSALEQTSLETVKLVTRISCSSASWGSSLFLNESKTILGLSDTHLQWSLPGAAIVVQKQVVLQLNDLTILTTHSKDSVLPSLVKVMERGFVTLNNVTLGQLECGTVHRKEMLEEQADRMQCRETNKVVVYNNSTILCKSSNIVGYSQTSQNSEQILAINCWNEEEETQDEPAAGSMSVLSILLISGTSFIAVASLSCLLYLSVRKTCTKQGRSLYSETKEALNTMSSETTWCYSAHSHRRTESCLSDVDVEKATFEYPIGKGEHGSVFKATYEEKVIAIKVINCAGKKNGASKEAYLAQSALHPNVVRSFCTLSRGSQDWEFPCEISKEDSFSSTGTSALYDFLQTSSLEKTHRNTWLIVMEFCDLGNLKAALHNEHLRDRYTALGVSKDYFLSKIAGDIAKGMQYLHSKDVLHGDLKPQNILLQTDDCEKLGFIAKIGDFGLSRDMTHTALVQTKTCGSVRYMSPELLREGLLSMKTDVYSFGVVLWEMVTGAQPFYGKSEVEVMLMVSEGRRPQPLISIPGVLGVLIRLCLQEDYAARPNFSHIIAVLEEQNKLDSVPFC